MQDRRNPVLKLLYENSLSIALFTLFLLSMIGQGLVGWSAYNQSLLAARFSAITLSRYLGTGDFLDGIFSNWQAAVLQLAVLIAFGSVLRQKGAAHSRKTGRASHRALKWKFGRRKTMGEWLYANSLSLAFLTLFLLTFLSHIVFGQWKFNENQMLRHLPSLPVDVYAGSAGFWFSVFECWEAEFAVIGLYIVFSIFLRQDQSPESKPVGAADSDTGDTNA